MMSNIEKYDFQGNPVRVVQDEQGEPWFVLADVCRAIGITNTSDVASRLSDDEKGVAKTDTLGGFQEFRIVSEPGLYIVVMRSNSPSAEPFRRWVTHDVLPSIRKHGGYMTAEMLAQALLDPDVLIRLATDLKTERAKTAALAAQTLALTPKAEAFDLFLSTSGDYSVNQAAKVLCRVHGIQTGEGRLWQWMLGHGWLYRASDGCPRAYQVQVDCGRLVHKAQWHYHPVSGERLLDPPQVRVTAKGLAKLAELLKPAEAPHPVLVGVS